jgi:hypothetical protein
MCYQASAAVTERKLKAILRGYEPPPIPVHLLHTSQSPQQPLKLRAFLGHVAPRLQERLRQIAEIFEPGLRDAPKDRAHTRMRSGKP